MTGFRWVSRPDEGYRTYTSQGSLSPWAPLESPLHMTRRRFVFWIGFGLFTLAERLRVEAFDSLAAMAMKGAKPQRTDASIPVHWSAAENRSWRWFEREDFVDGRWKLTAVTTPVHKRTGEPLAGKDGYIDEELVPLEVRSGNRLSSTTLPTEIAAEFAERHPSPKRRSRHGRPPSKWLRSLDADEIRIWLKTIEVPEAGVSGMTYWEHLTRDHSFDPANIEGLTEEEQAELHAAAHYGY